MTDEKIAEWIANPFWRDANIALRAEGWIGIDVDAYEGKQGDKTLAALEEELGELPMTITSTARGQGQPSRIHFFRVPEGLRFVTRFPDVEIVQHSHRYAAVFPSVHPKTGAVYSWYGYDEEPLADLPAIDDFEELPPAWLERLSIPDDHSEADGFDGTLADWLERVPGGSLGMFMGGVVDDIPKTPFGHDVMVSLQARIVSQASQGEPGAAEALKILRREWLRGEFDTEDYRRDWDTSLESAIKKFGAVPDRAEDILAVDQADAYTKVTEPGFLDLWMSLPPVVTEASLRERVERIMSAAFLSGVSLLEAASLGWHSAAAQQPQGPRKDGLEALWALAQHVAAHPVVEESEHEPEAPEPEDEPSGMSLLSESERHRRRQIQWWGDEFMDVMHELNAVMTDSYYRLNRWMILSLAFGDRAVLHDEQGDDTLLNVYGIMVGPSHTGKSRSTTPLKQMAKLIGAAFGEGNPNIGSRATTAGLVEALIPRDGMASLFMSDEADQTLLDWRNQQGPYHGMAKYVTQIYDEGEVPKVNLATRKESSGKDVFACLNVHMAGVPEDMLDSIDPRDWRNGFINRFVWAIGERKRTNDEQKRRRYVTEGSEKATTDLAGTWYQTWMARFNTVRTTILRGEPGKPRTWVGIEEAVLDRDVAAQARLKKIAAASPYTERLEPTFDRLATTIWKCAALVAISDRRITITLDDYIVALEQAEEWAENIIRMVELTDETPRAREVNRLLEIIKKNGGSMAEKDIHRIKAHAGEQKATRGLIDELVAQGRVEILRLTDGNVVRAEQS